MIPLSARLFRIDTTRIRNLIVPPQGFTLVPFRDFPIFELMDAAAFQIDLHLIHRRRRFVVESVFGVKLFVQICRDFFPDLCFVNVGRNAANGLEEQNEAEEDGIDEHHFGRGFEEAATTQKRNENG